MNKIFIVYLFACKFFLEYLLMGKVIFLCTKVFPVYSSSGYGISHVHSDFSYPNMLGPRGVWITETFGSEHHRKMYCVVCTNEWT